MESWATPPADPARPVGHGISGRRPPRPERPWPSRLGGSTAKFLPCFQPPIGDLIWPRFHEGRDSTSTARPMHDRPRSCRRMPSTHAPTGWHLSYRGQAAWPDIADEDHGTAWLSSQCRARASTRGPWRASLWRRSDLCQWRVALIRLPQDGSQVDRSSCLMCCRTSGPAHFRAMAVGLRECEGAGGTS